MYDQYGYVYKPYDLHKKPKCECGTDSTIKNASSWQHSDYCPKYVPPVPKDDKKESLKKK